MESNEREKADPDGSTSSSYFAMIKISPRTREARYRAWVGEGTRRLGDGERQMQVQPAPRCGTETYGRTSGRRWD
jgi:hypothetical protein